MQTKSIKTSMPDAKEKTRRRREFILAGAAFTLIILLTWIELRYIGVDSYLFLALFNLNFILLILVLYIVGRNGVKLLLERRRNVLGSKLRTRLVLAFISLSLVPTVLMFMVSLKFVQTSVDFWFKSQVETSMERSLDVGRSFYTSAQELLSRRGENILVHIRGEGLAWGGKSMDTVLEAKRREYGLSLLGVTNPDQSEQNWHMADEFAQDWPEIKARLNWKSLREQPRFWSTLWAGQAGDFVVGVLPVDEGETGYLILAENLGHDLMFKLDQIVRGVDEYKKLKSLKSPLKMALYFILGMLTLLIILGAMWFGFRLAKELSAPIQALAAGTERIAQGDLSVRVEDSSTDELGLLVGSFNKMAGDLEQSRTGLTEANLSLASKNLELEERGSYIEAVLDNIAAGVVSLDQDGRISTVNKAAGEMFGVNPMDILGLHPEELLRGQFAELFDDAAEQMEKNPASRWTRQLDLTLGGQQRKLVVNMVALTSGESREQGVVAVFEDITEMENIQRLAAWREVAKRIAHEIKNPLTPIKLSAQRLERKFSADVDDPAFSGCTNLIVQQVEHLQQMVKEFSAFAKLPEVTLRPDALPPLLEEVMELFRHSHSGIRWDLEIDKDAPEMRMDREAIRRVLINILTNAAEVLDGRSDGAVSVHMKQNGLGDRVRLEIRDNGPGLTSEERSRLFEPYFSRKKGGTGLGLTIVKSIVSDHHGYIRAALNKGGGTTFIIELPTG